MRLIPIICADTSTSTSASSSSEGSGDEESLDLSSSEDTSEQYQKLRAEYQKMCDKYDDLRTQFSVSMANAYFIQKNHLIFFLRSKNVLRR